MSKIGKLHKPSLVFFDENLSLDTLEGFKLLTRKNFSDIECLATEIILGKGAVDELIVPYIAERDGLFITLDRKLISNLAQMSMVKENKLRIVVLRTQGRYWETVRTLVWNWEKVIDYHRRSSKPFALELKDLKFKQLW